MFNLLLIINICCANIYSQTRVNELVGLNKYEFDRFLESNLDTVKSFDFLYVLDEVILERFNTEVYTFGENILDICNHHLKLEEFNDKSRIRFVGNSQSVNFLLQLITLTKPDISLNKELVNLYLEFGFSHDYTFIMPRLTELNKETKFEEFLVTSVEENDSLRRENILNYLNQSYNLGVFYKKSEGTQDLAEKYFINIRSYPIRLEPDSNLKDDLYKIYVKASDSLLQLRRNDLKMLERTFFWGYKNYRLEKLKENYIQKLEK